MIDLHCHILPGIDDGSQSMDDTLDMARAAVDEGISHIVATPHHNLRQFQNPKTEVAKLTSQVNKVLNDHSIPLIISAGQEVRLSGNLIELIDGGEIAFLDDKESYLLVEFPTSRVPEYTNHIFFELYNREITPVIAHPERNHSILENPDILYDLVNGGALAQLTASSYTGHLGKKLEKYSKQLIEANLVHVIASDAHNVDSRPSHLAQAYTKLKKEYGEDIAEQFELTTQSIFNGEYIYPSSPERVKKKRFFGLF